MNIPSRNISLLAVLGLALPLLSYSALTHADNADPPDRVARLAFITGDVSLAPKGAAQWSQASLNRPLLAGDRLVTASGARIALETGGGDEIRVDGNSGFRFLQLDDQGTQIELTKGSLSWRVSSNDAAQSHEVDTPTLAFVATQPGVYRIDVTPDGGATTISQFSGAGTVYGSDGASYALNGQQSWRITDPHLGDVAGTPLARADDFDRWGDQRDERMQNSVSARYVAPQVVGYSDLDVYGDWDRADAYGEVWYPRTVVTGWAPYRYGHWAWIAPWGWTWIDDAPWGFAPFHYGRWVYLRERWGWVPGPPRVRPVYCPALVAFVGGGGWSVSVSSGAPIGWLPLGPRDVYVPWYRGSRRYFTNVNVSNTTVINNTQITNVYNNDQHHRGQHQHYMHQQVPGATTVVTHDAFTHGRPVREAQLRVDEAHLAKAPVLTRERLPQGRPGLGLNASTSTHQAPAEIFARPMISHRELPRGERGPRAAADSQDSAHSNAPSPRAEVNVDSRGATPRARPWLIERGPTTTPPTHQPPPSQAQAHERNADVESRGPSRDAAQTQSAPEVDRRETRRDEALPSSHFAPHGQGFAERQQRRSQPDQPEDRGGALARPELQSAQPAHSLPPPRNPMSDAQRMPQSPREQPTQELPRAPSMPARQPPHERQQLPTPQREPQAERAPRAERAARERPERGDERQRNRD